MIGSSDQANHQYDLSDFDAALSSGNLPSVSFLKAAAFEDGHPSNSDPLDEQHFIARTLNALEQSPDWSSTAVIIAYDDSDGWYDHVMSPITSPSATPADALNGAGKCGNVPAGSTAYPDRCGYGPRQPLLVVSPYAKVNYVDHALTDQTSVLKFIEDNWQLGRIGDQSFDARAGSIGNLFDFNPEAKRAPKVFLDPESGQVVKSPPATGTPTPTPTPSSVSVTTTVGGTVEGATDPAPAAAVKTPSVDDLRHAGQAQADVHHQARGEVGQRLVRRDRHRRQEQGHRGPPAPGQGLLGARDDAHDAQARQGQGHAQEPQGAQEGQVHAADRGHPQGRRDRHLQVRVTAR